MTMEREHLLSDDSSAQDLTQDGVDTQQRRSQSHVSSWFFACTFTIKFLAQFTTSLLEIPLLGLVERAICWRYFPDSDPLEDGSALCKSSAVQDKLAIVMGFKTAFDSIPCLITAIGYGKLADSKGRKFVLSLSVIGQILALAWVCTVCFPRWQSPIDIVWLGSAFLFIGGGGRLELSMIYTMFSDVVPQEDRTRALYFLHAATHFARLIGPFLGSKLMEKHLWAPFVLAAFTLHLRIILLAFISETSTKVKQCGHAQATDEQSATHRPMLSETTVLKYAQTTFRDGLMRMRKSRVFIFCRHRGLAILFACFTVKRIGFASESLSFQYASERQHRPILTTFWLRISNALGATVILGLILPLLDRASQLPSPNKDIRTIQRSLIVLIIGFIILWQGTTFAVLCLGMAVCGLGEGFEPSLQSVGAFIVGQQNYASFFTFISALDVIGDILGGPTMAAAYTFRDGNGLPAGLCFTLSSILFSILLGLSVKIDAAPID